MTCSGECVIKGAVYSASHITLHSAPHFTITRQTSVQVPVLLSLFSALLSCTDPGCRSLQFYLTAGQESTLETDLGAVDGEWRRILNLTFNVGSRLYLNFFNSKNIPINGINSRFQLK